MSGRGLSAAGGRRQALCVRYDEIVFLAAFCRGKNNVFDCAADLSFCCSALLAIRWILKPVRWLSDGVRQVSSGNFDYRMPVKRLDEFGTLAEAFNSMTGRIREMLHARERLLLDVSHELRSPITRMKVALEFMPDSAVAQGMRADIHDMETMISEILETQRLGSPYGSLNLEETDPGVPDT